MSLRLLSAKVAGRPSFTDPHDSSQIGHSGFCFSDMMTFWKDSREFLDSPPVLAGAISLRAPLNVRSISLSPPEKPPDWYFKTGLSPAQC
jgi:hypothetical protein